MSLIIMQVQNPQLQLPPRPRDVLDTVSFGNRARVRRWYESMLEEWPALHVDEEAGKRLFKVLARYAPSLASDPTAAGSWVSQQKELCSERGEVTVDPSQIDRLTRIQQRIDERGTY